MTYFPRRRFPGREIFLCLARHAEILEKYALSARDGNIVMFGASRGKSIEIYYYVLSVGVLRGGEGGASASTDRYCRRPRCNWDWTTTRSYDAARAHTSSLAAFVQRERAGSYEPTQRRMILRLSSPSYLGAARMYVDFLVEISP